MKLCFDMHAICLCLQKISQNNKDWSVQICAIFGEYHTDTSKCYFECIIVCVFIQNHLFLSRTQVIKFIEV